MEGTTLANHVAATTLVSKKGNFPILYGDHGATAAATVFDASSSAVKIHLNLASTWNQSSSEDVSFSARIVLFYRVLGSNFGVE
jgi:hypothetical protein